MGSFAQSRTPSSAAALRRLATVALLPVFASLTLPRSGSAQEWTTERPADVAGFGLESIDFEGEIPVPESELRDAIRSRSSGGLRFRAVDLDRLEGDIQRVRNRLRRHGYWKAEASLQMYWDPGRRAGRAVFRVDPGVQRLVGRITTAGNRTFPETEILTWTKLRTGEPFDIGRTDRDRKSIENTYANRGFYQVSVTADIQPAEGDSVPVVHDLVYRIEEGPRYVVGAIRVEGNEFTKTDIIRRELTLRPGEVLSRDRIDESRERLYATGYFSTVAVLPEEGSSPEAVGLVIRVTERRMRYISAGVGYGTRDQLRLAGEWGNRNLRGRGRRTSIRGVLATELFPADLVRTRLEARYVEPWLFNTRTIGSLELSFERRRELSDAGEEEYDLGLVSLLANVSRQLARHTRGWVTLENEWADVDPRDPDFELPDEQRPEITRSLTTTLERDRRDDYFDAHKGALYRGTAGFSGAFLGGDADFWRWQLEGQWFRTSGDVVLAGRFRVGYEQPFGSSDFVPDRERFKLGGPSTVRGYEYQEIGPGDFLLLGNVEARVPIFWRFSLGAFLDGGNAWENLKDVSWKDFRVKDSNDDPTVSVENDVRYAAGVGLRLATPVGPVRLDVARRLKILTVAPGHPDDESRWGYHLTLGNVF